MDRLENVIFELKKLSNLNNTVKIQHWIDDAIRNLQLVRFEMNRHTEIKKWILDEIQINFEQSKNLYSLENDIDMTSLAEECCSHFEVDFESGPLDRDDHWIWKDVYDHLQHFINYQNDSKFNTNNI